MTAKNIDKYVDNDGLKQIDIRRDNKFKNYLKKGDVVLDFGCG